MLRESVRLVAAEEAASAIERPSSLRAFVGFDGFIDVILRAVDARTTMRRDDYTPIRSITLLADRIAAAAGKSANLELVPVEQRFGGNGPLLAGALASIGATVTYVGCVGSSGMATVPGPVHDRFAPFADRCERVLPIAPPATTHALEFEDGKIMLNMPDAIQGVTWATLVRDLGLETLRTLLQPANLVGVVNWSIMAGVESILVGLRDDILAPQQRVQQPRKRVFIDLSDPAKRSREDIRRLLNILTSLETCADVTLGLNLSEAQQVCGVLACESANLSVSAAPSLDELARICPAIASQVREAIAINCVVVHPRQGAAASTNAHTCWIDGPLTRRPALSTGAGDHFNAGFAHAQTLGCSLPACLAMGVGASGAYVRDAVSPSALRLAKFLRELPMPEA